MNESPLMKLKLFLLSLLAGTAILFSASCIGTSPDKSLSERETTNFDEDWKFSRFGETPDGFIDEPVGLESIDWNDDFWQQETVPHDWGIESDFLENQPNSTGKLMFQGIGWYRKHFNVPTTDKGKCFSIRFDGIMSEPTVYLNGELVGEWKYGYSSFALDLTDKINFGGDNVIAVRVDNKADSSRWYPGGGIYRHVWLTKAEPVHVANWGTYITTPQISNNSATVTIETELENLSGSAQKAEYYHIIRNKTTGKTVAQSLTQTIDLQTGINTPDKIEVKVANPLLWDTQSPNLYIAQTVVSIEGCVTDKYQTTFGIRSIEWSASQGFLLNGKVVKINGVCNHHDLGPLGTAVNDRAVQRQLEIMKEMGCNSIRTSHNPPAPELLAFCDEMGLMVMDEAFDCWELKKTNNDYHRFFKDWYKKDITNLVKRDRNHPCIILWSSGNEIREQWARPHDLEVSHKLTDLFHELDPSRPVAAGCNQPNSYKNGFGSTVDIYGFNYKPHLYNDFKNTHPDQPVFSSESSSCISSRGEYYFPVSNNKANGFFNYQVSSYDLYAPPWAMKPDIEFEGQDNYPFIAGEYVWTGFDYIGEPTPYNNDKTLLINYHTEAEKKEIEEKLSKMKGSPSRSSYFGIVDLCGFPKDRFYLYQSRWRPELPMAHILPHWNWPGREGEITPVHVYTSGDEAELFLNGRSLGRKAKAKPGTLAPDISLPTSLSAGKNAEASTSEENNASANGNDNNIKTRWCASSDSADNFWQVDLGENQKLGSCVIYWENDSSAYAYEILVSQDGKKWEKTSQATYAGRNNYSLHKFSAEGRYLKVQFTGLKNYWASFYECQVFAQDVQPEIIDPEAIPEAYRLRWDNVIYEPGELKAIAYKDGKKWAEDSVKTTGKAYTVKLTADRNRIKADGCDLSFITIDIVDNNGNIVPRSNNMVNLSITGPGVIEATGNGDATNSDCFKNTSRNAYNGKMLAIIKSEKNKPGTIKLTAESEGLKSQTITIETATLKR